MIVLDVAFETPRQRRHSVLGSRFLVKHPEGCGLKERSRSSEVRALYLFLSTRSCDLGWKVFRASSDC